MKLETQEQMARAIAADLAQREAGRIRPSRRTGRRENWDCWERLDGDAWVRDDAALYCALMRLRDQYIEVATPKADRYVHYVSMMYGIKRVESFARRDARFAPEHRREEGTQATAMTESAVDPDRATEVPEFEARVSPSGVYLIFRCPHCKADHAHGADGGYGSRTAHCWRPNSPYRPRGYVLVRRRDSA